MKHLLQWQVGHSNSVEAQPEQWVPAQVPGAVQLDWARAHDWPRTGKPINYRAYEWMEDVSGPIAPLARKTRDGGHVFLVGKGVDYQYQIRIGGEVVYEHEGMFAPFEIDMTGKSGEVEIVVFPAPKSEALDPTYARRQANQSCKPAVSTAGFSSTSESTGIWTSASLSASRRAHRVLASALRINRDNASASRLVSTCAFRQGEEQCVGRILDAITTDPLCKRLKAQSFKRTLTQTIDNPRCGGPTDRAKRIFIRRSWNCSDSNGNVTDVKSQRFGARRVRLVMFPRRVGRAAKVSRHAQPAAGDNRSQWRALFSAKGSNWVCPDIFPGTLTREIYAEHLQLARDAHFNLLRCWGGAIVNKDDFFELCDEMGLMVWQEFPLACNRYEGTPSICEYSMPSRAALSNVCAIMLALSSGAPATNCSTHGRA
jgi:beta-mannosidase